MIHPSLHFNMPQLIELFEKHKVENVYVFGSALTSHFNENSDVDFLINFQAGIEPLEKGELWWNLYDALKAQLNREVDLVSEGALKNPYFIKELNQTKVKIYG